MDQVKEFFYRLLSTASWPPRWHCGKWTDFHGWLYIASDLLIWFSYFMIPVIIINYLAKKKHALKFNKTYLYFAAFIVLCGTTHFLDAVMFWFPMYRLNALVRFATALVSLLTVYHLIKLLPVAFSQKTSLELEQEILRRLAAERQLELANQRLAGFASMASHDLQEPLRKISTYGEMLRVDNTDKLDADGLRQIDKITDAASRMKLLIDDILLLSSIQQEIELTPLDPQRSLEKAISDLEIKITEKQAMIDVSALPKISGNDVYLTQLFLNLLSNALKFNSGQPVIHITGRQEADRVIINISDNGIGIEATNFSKIFEAFQRLHTKASYAGTGIGLTICKNIMDAHKGEITLSSKPGQGTNFELTFLAAK